MSMQFWKTLEEECKTAWVSKKDTILESWVLCLCPHDVKRLSCPGKARQEQASSALPSEEAVFSQGMKASSAFLPLMDISPQTA